MRERLKTFPQNLWFLFSQKMFGTKLKLIYCSRKCYESYEETAATGSGLLWHSIPSQVCTRHLHRIGATSTSCYRGHTCRYAHACRCDSVKIRAVCMFLLTASKNTKKARKAPRACEPYNTRPCTPQFRSVDVIHGSFMHLDPLYLAHFMCCCSPSSLASAHEAQHRNFK